MIHPKKFQNKMQTSLIFYEMNFDLLTLMFVVFIFFFSNPPSGEMIISNDRYLMTETENSMYACTMTLVVRKIQKSDMGGYKCISKNSIGDAEGTIRLYGECKLSEYWTEKRWNRNVYA